ncbi:Crp/Fnr family transcriptional regulator [Roseovarius arcticus]|uniref:Crp/Fnr family transcriptional regulator n=1 Tax=Roseovarius arcticus TaxID=2547404 RepID=UPI001110F540|nr:helix-turn-helix domain-containing protein [Roseovarius arcticus]
MTASTTDFREAKFSFRAPETKLVPKSSHAFPIDWSKNTKLNAPRTSGQPSDTAKYRRLYALFNAGSFEQHFQPNSTIALHGEAAAAVYLIASGTVRCCTISAGGCRQISCFAKKGGFVGLSEMGNWHLTAEAVDHVIVKSIPRAALEHALTVDTELRQEIRMYVLELLECREKQLLTLISTKAADRLFQFLCDFAASKQKAGHVVLPMCRQDIADHLGLSTETVSRGFTELKRAGRIDLATTEKYKICKVAGIDAEAALGMRVM